MSTEAEQIVAGLLEHAWLAIGAVVLADSGPAARELLDRPIRWYVDQGFLEQTF